MFELAFRVPGALLLTSELAATATLHTTYLLQFYCLPI